MLAFLVAASLLAACSGQTQLAPSTDVSTARSAVSNAAAPLSGRSLESTGTKVPPKIPRNLDRDDRFSQKIDGVLVAGVIAVRDIDLEVDSSNGHTRPSTTSRAAPSQSRSSWSN